MTVFLCDIKIHNTISTDCTNFFLCYINCITDAAIRLSKPQSNYKKKLTSRGKVSIS